VTSLASAGDIATHSGGDTLIEASQLNAQGAIDLAATGYAATSNADGSTNAGRAGKITFAAVKDSTYNNVVNSNNSLVWQNSSGSGENVETLKLANISAGKGLSVNATGGVAIDIPTVQATPAPAAQTDVMGKIIPPAPLTAEQQSAQRQSDLNKALQNLASQPGQAWIGQLANDPKVQVQWNQVQTAAQHWNYAHDGLTQEAVVVIAIAVAYFTAGAGSSMVGTTTAVEGGAAGATATTIGGTTLATTTAAGTVSYTVAGAVINAGFTALASEAAVSFANNKGDIGKTLQDLGSKESVKSVVASMLTAGVGQAYAGTYNVESLAAKTAAGCASGALTGSGCQNGAEVAGAMGAAAWAGDAMRQNQIQSSSQFKGIKECDSNGVCSSTTYTNLSGNGSVGIHGDGTQLQGTRLDLGFEGLGKYGTVTSNGDGTFKYVANSNVINQDTNAPYSLAEAIAKTGGMTGGSQALPPTFNGIALSQGSFMNVLQESYAGPHDYLGGVVWNGYDALGNANINQPAWIRNIMAAIDIPMATPIALSTLNTQYPGFFDAVNNTIQLNNQKTKGNK
jgi:hypothetical protein